MYKSNKNNISPKNRDVLLNYFQTFDNRFS